MSVNESKSYLFKIMGENIEPKPARTLEITDVYLIIDERFKIIWIWSGKKSRLFHRYVAASWAGKLKFRKRFTEFKYRMIKQDQEPEEFLDKFKKIINTNGDINKLIVNNEFLGDIKEYEDTESFEEYDMIQRNGTYKRDPPFTYQRIAEKTKESYHILSSDHSKMKILFEEIKEIYSHMVYTLQHVEQNINQIEEIMKKIEK